MSVKLGVEIVKYTHTLCSFRVGACPVLALVHASYFCLKDYYSLNSEHILWHIYSNRSPSKVPAICTMVASLHTYRCLLLFNLKNGREPIDQTILISRARPTVSICHGGTGKKSTLHLNQDSPSVWPAADYSASDWLFSPFNQLFLLLRFFVGAINWPTAHHTHIGLR